MELLDKTSIAALGAIQRSMTDLGFDVRRVLSANDWAVATVDGQAEVILSKKGALALCSMAPDQDAARWVASVAERAA